jgi:hypothetical protein
VTMAHEGHACRLNLKEKRSTNLRGTPAVALTAARASDALIFACFRLAASNEGGLWRPPHAHAG